jgi:probable HAF family extracellular repeat protein
MTEAALFYRPRLKVRSVGYLQYLQVRSSHSLSWKWRKRTLYQKPRGTDQPHGSKTHSGTEILFPQASIHTKRRYEFAGRGKCRSHSLRRSVLALLNLSSLRAAPEESYYHGFLDSGGSYTTLNVPGAIQTSADAINAQGQIVGDYFGSNGPHSGFLYSGGIYTTIDPPGSYSTTLTGINAKGQIVGYFTESNGGPPHGFLYSHGTYTVLDFPGAIDTETVSINASGQIVGFFENGVAGSGPGGSGGQITSQDAFLYSGGKYTTIGPPGGTAYSINNKGQVVGEYDANGTDHGFIATPTHPGHLHYADLANLAAMARHKVGATEVTQPELTTLVNFNGTDGAQPVAGLIADAYGDLLAQRNSAGRTTTSRC